MHDRPILSVTRRALAVGLLGVVVVVGLAGCTTSKRKEPEPTRYRPAAYQPEHFPDIPLWPLAGYELDPNEDQLAVAFAGGTVRRFEVTMVARPGTRDDPPDAVLARYDGALAENGWIREAPGRWRKGGERLLIEAGRGGGSTIVRFHLRPAD